MQPVSGSHKNPVLSTNHLTNAGDRRSRKLYQKLVQVVWYKKFACVLLNLTQYKFLVRNWAQLHYSTDTVQHVTQTVQREGCFDARNHDELCKFWYKFLECELQTEDQQTKPRYNKERLKITITQVSEWAEILNGTSAQLDNTEPFTLVHAGKYRTEDKLKTDTIQKLNTTTQENYSYIVMLRFPNFDFRSISIRFLAQNDDFDSIQF